MRKEYDNTLQVMLQGDEQLGGVIKKFVDSFPKRFNSKIDGYNKKEGIVIENKKRWFYEEKNRSFGVSVGSENPSAQKDFMNLCLNPISDDRLKSWPRFEGPVLIGYVTLYVYENEDNFKGQPTQVFYDFYAERIEKKVVMNVSVRVNSAYKNSAQRLENLGINEMNDRIVGARYVIDTNKILTSKGGR